MFHSPVSDKSDVWRSFLPPELHPFLPSRAKDCKWLYISSSVWPTILVSARDSFWAAVKGGKDVKDISQWLGGDDFPNLIDFLSRDEGAALTILCPKVEPSAVLNNFLTAAMTSGADILSLSNFQDGELDNKLLGTKRGVLSQLKSVVDGLVKLRDVSIPTESGKSFPAPGGQRGGALDADFFDPSTVESIDIRHLDGGISNEEEKK